MKLSKYQTEIKLALLFAIAILSMPDFAFAQTAVDFGAGQSSFAGSELSYGPTLASAVAYVAGTIFCFAGILKLKAHSENPGQTPITHGLGRLVAGGALLALPTVTTLAQSTWTTGTGASSAAGFQTITPGLN